MQVIRVNPKFTPVSIVLESEAEVAFVCAVLGRTSSPIEKPFGLSGDVGYGMYKALRDSIDISKWPRVVGDLETESR